MKDFWHHLWFMFYIISPAIVCLVATDIADRIRRGRGREITVWVARDCHGPWHAFTNKPERVEGEWQGGYLGRMGWVATPEILRLTWEDEPIQVRVSVEVVK